MTRLEVGKSIIRQITIPDVGEVIVSISAGGVSLRGYGQRKELFQTWEGLLKAFRVPLDAPARYAESPARFLKGD